MINVVAGIVRNKDGKIFIAQRNNKAKQGGKWEFPGGKVEINEQYTDALVREFKEELNMNVEVDSYLDSSIYDYGDRIINLIGFICTMKDDHLELLEHEDYRFVSKEELYNYDFAENDKHFIKLINNDIVELVRDEIIRRSIDFYNKTKGTKDEYNLYQAHVKYVYKYACMLLNNNKNVDKEVIKLSALLHDIAMTDINLGVFNHNETGLPIIDELLNKYNYPKDKIEFVKKCVLNHSNKRKDFRTTEEEKILVNADCLSHFDNVDSLFTLATKVNGLNEEDSIKFVQEKLTKDYNELSDDLKPLVEDKYNRVINMSKVR